MTENTKPETIIDGVTTVKLGDRVVYTDGKGFEKLAFVTGTQDSVKVVQPQSTPICEDEDCENADCGASGESGVQPVKDGHAHLLVFSPSGATYARRNIPQGAGPNTFVPIV